MLYLFNRSPNLGFLVYYLVIATIISGGAILLLLVGGILSIQREDPLNVFLNVQTELAIFSLIGIVLITCPLWLVPHIRSIIYRKQIIKLGVIHHSRNRAQEILFALDMLESEIEDENQITMIKNARASCFAMLESLESVIESDGENIDYSLVLKKRR